MLGRLIDRVSLAWRSYGLAAMFVLMFVSNVWAQEYGQEEAKPKNYAPCYLIIIFAVTGGMMAICYAGKRHADFRRNE